MLSGLFLYNQKEEDKFTVYIHVGVRLKRVPLQFRYFVQRTANY